MSNEELAQLYQNGDKPALNRLVEQNKGIVYKLVNKFYVEKTSSIDKEDLEQEGFLGLITAADKYKFDVEHPCKFITYAVYWIYQRIQRFITSKNTNAEISINTPLGDDNMELLDTIKDEKCCYENIEDRIYNKQLREELETVMNKHNTLTEREILKLHYGWDNNECMSFNDIAELLRLNKNNVRWIEYRAMGKMRRTSWGVEKAKEIYNYKVSESKYSIDRMMGTINFADKYLEL